MLRSTKRRRLKRAGSWVYAEGRVAERQTSVQTSVPWPHLGSFIQMIDMMFIVRGCFRGTWKYINAWCKVRVVGTKKQNTARGARRRSSGPTITTRRHLSPRTIMQTQSFLWKATSQGNTYINIYISEDFPTPGISPSSLQRHATHRPHRCTKGTTTERSMWRAETGQTLFGRFVGPSLWRFDIIGIGQSPRSQHNAGWDKVMLRKNVFV